MAFRGYWLREFSFSQTTRCRWLRLGCSPVQRAAKEGMGELPPSRGSVGQAAGGSTRAEEDGTPKPSPS